MYISKKGFVLQTCKLFTLTIQYNIRGNTYLCLKSMEKADALGTNTHTHTHTQSGYRMLCCACALRGIIISIPLGA